MTCNKCEHCTQVVPFYEKTMAKAAAVNAFVKDHDGHPQFERIKFPNRIAIGDFYLGLAAENYVAAGYNVNIYREMDPNTDPEIFVGACHISLYNPDKPPAILDSQLLHDLVDQFNELLRTEFFQG